MKRQWNNFRQQVYLFYRFLQRNKFRQKKGKEEVRCLDPLSGTIPPSDTCMAPSVSQAKASPRPHTTTCSSTHRRCLVVCVKQKFCFQTQHPMITKIGQSLMTHRYKVLATPVASWQVYSIERNPRVETFIASSEYGMPVSQAK